MVVVPQSLEQLKKETITNQAHVCWHPRNLCFDFLNNARELLLRQALGALKESLSAVVGSKCKQSMFWFYFLNLLILCEFIKVSGKKYIIRKVWLYTIYTIYQLCNGWVEFLSYFSVYIQTHNGTLKSHYAFEYTHYNSSKLQETKSPLSLLISSLQSHLHIHVLFSWNCGCSTKFGAVEKRDNNKPSSCLLTSKKPLFWFFK